MSWDRPRGGVPCCRVQGSPVPPRRAVGARRWVGGPPPPSPPWRPHALSARNRSGVPLALSSTPLFYCTGSARCMVLSPSSSVSVPSRFAKSPWPSLLPGAPALSVHLPLLPAHGLRMLMGLGGPFFVLGPAARWGPVLPCTGVPRAPKARCGRAPLGGGSPPSFPPLAAARVKRAQPFRGSPCLVLDSAVLLHGERALHGFVPLLLRFRPLSVCQVPMAVLATGGPRVVWTPLCCLRRQ